MRLLAIGSLKPCAMTLLELWGPWIEEWELGALPTTFQKSQCAEEEEGQKGRETKENSGTLGIRDAWSPSWGQEEEQGCVSTSAYAQKRGWSHSGIAKARVGWCQSELAQDLQMETGEYFLNAPWRHFRVINCNFYTYMDRLGLSA